MDLTTQYVMTDGRRLGTERRIFSYTDHLPERRSGQDRRSSAEQGRPHLYLVKPE